MKKTSKQERTIPPNYYLVLILKNQIKGKPKIIDTVLSWTVCCVVRMSACAPKSHRFDSQTKELPWISGSISGLGAGCVSRGQPINGCIFLASIFFSLPKKINGVRINNNKNFFKISKIEHYDQI